MAEREQVQWLDGQANVSDTVEKIFPARHIGEKQWQSEWKEMYRGRWSYDYISDYECIFNHPIDANVTGQEGCRENLQAAKLQGTRVAITNLAHFTTEEVVQAIVKSGGFSGGTKRLT